MLQILRIPFAVLMLAAGLAATYELFEAFNLHSVPDILFRVQVAIALYLASMFAGSFMSLLPVVLPPRMPPPTQ